MRLMVAAAAIACLGAATASAQVASGVGRVAGITVHRPPPPPLAPPAPPPARGPVHGHPPPQPFGGDLFRAHPRTYAPRFHRQFKPNRFHTVIAPFPYLVGASFQVPSYVILRDGFTYGEALQPDGGAYSDADDAGSVAARQPDNATLPEAPAPLPVVPVPAPKTLYVIPRCYAGDRRPEADELPAGCDIRALRVIRPRTP